MRNFKKKDSSDQYKIESLFLSTVFKLLCVRHSKVQTYNVVQLYTIAEV